MTFEIMGVQDQVAVSHPDMSMCLHHCAQMPQKQVMANVRSSECDPFADWGAQWMEHAHADGKEGGGRAKVPRRHRKKRGNGCPDPKQMGSPCEVVPQEMLLPALPSEERCQELREQLKAGGEAMASAVASIRGMAWRLSLDADGCFVVQDAIEFAREATAVANELSGHILEASTGPHANYVVQKLIKHLPSDVASFMAQELLDSGRAAQCARHRFGCRIICRLLEFTLAQESTQHLVDFLLLVDSEALNLIHHKFGRHVAKSILEHALSRHKERVFNVIYMSLYSSAMHHHGSYVVEAALQLMPPTEQQLILSGLLDPMILQHLALSRFGWFVARTVLERPDVDAKMLASRIPAVAMLMWSMAAFPDSFPKESNEQQAQKSCRMTCEIMGVQDQAVGSHPDMSMCVQHRAQMPQQQMMARPLLPMGMNATGNMIMMANCTQPITSAGSPQNSLPVHSSNPQAPPEEAMCNIHSLQQHGCSSESDPFAEQCAQWTDHAHVNGKEGGGMPKMPRRHRKKRGNGRLDLKQTGSTCEAVPPSRWEDQH